MKNIGLLFGGKSPEHEISVRSAKNIYNAFDNERYNVLLLAVDPSGIWWSQDIEQLGTMVQPVGQRIGILPGAVNPFYFFDSNQPLPPLDAIFPIIHGPYGEDGTLQGMLRILDIPFVGPDVLGSSASMDKDITKRLLRDAGIKVAPGRVFRNKEAAFSAFQSLSEDLGEVLFVKPANMGSSVGVHKISNETEYREAIMDAFHYDSKVLVEGLIEGREVECAVLGNEDVAASGIGEIITPEEYSFDAKYVSDTAAQIIIPAEISESDRQRLREVAMQAYKALNCEGMSRVDMFFTPSGEIFVNEINTLPGFTSISMYPKLWGQEGVAYSDLLTKLVDLAMERHYKRSQLNTVRT